MIQSLDYRDAMAFLTTAVSVVTTDGQAGRYGITASAVCSVTDTPPTLLVCVNQSSSAHPPFLINKKMAVNVLTARHEHISKAFASKMSPEERFAQADWTTFVTGAPILKDALSCFDCEIEQTHDVGTHTILVCRVVALKRGQEKHALAYFNRSYHHVGGTVVT